MICYLSIYLFQVAHFSKYKLEADDSEDEGDQQQQQQPQGGGPGLVKKLKTVQVRAVRERCERS